TQVGSRATLDVIRGGKRQNLSVVVGERPTEEQLAKLTGGGGAAPDSGGAVTATPQRVLGLSLTPLTADIARAANLPAGTRGVLITAVDPSSAAGEEGLQRGDVIVSINQLPVTTPAQVVAAVDAARRAGRSSILLLIKRGTAPETFVGIDITAR
ncbi:MAG: PDZ domain-containing protein, partial [Pseudomonadota bacterium]